MKRAAAAGGALFALMVLAVHWTSLRGQRFSPEELAARCAQCNPSWANYDEDLKAGVGAAAVARWSGTLERIALRQDMLEVVIRVESPWSGYSCAIPILARDPAGNVLRSTDAGGEGATRVYRFRLAAGAAAAALPWVTVRYPRNEVRAVMPENGVWTR